VEPLVAQLSVLCCLESALCNLVMGFDLSVDWWAGKWLAEAKTPTTKKAFLLLSLSVNLGLLGFFKYGTFLLENFQQLLSLLNLSFQPASPDIVLPVGISFYTFQSMSYVWDIYREIEATTWPRERFWDVFAARIPG